MASRFFAIGTLGTLAALAAAGAVSTLRHAHLRPAAAPGTAHLLAFGSRGAQQLHSAARSKFDGALADLSRHATLARPDHAVEDLQSLAPGVRFRASAGAPLVLIDAVTRGDPERLKAALVALGLQHPAVYSNDVGGWLPVTQLDAATARDEVHAIRAAISRTRTGAVTSQGDFAQRSDVMRSANSLTGAGVTVGVLSDSYDCYAVYAANNVPAGGAAGYASNGFLATAATDVSTGDLPSNVNVLEEAEAGEGGCMAYNPPIQLPFSDEGRAMLQVVHDVAPAAGLAFHTADNSEADFAAGIGKLAAPVASGGAGATVIADDVGYIDEPFFQDGIVAQAIDAVQAQGAAYFSAAGNDGTLAYDNISPAFDTVSSTAPNSGEHLLNFDASGTTTVTALPVTIAPLVPGEFVGIVVEWDQPYVTGAPNSGGATSHIDVCITGASGTDEIIDYAGNAATCSGPNATGSDSYQVMIVANPANAGGNTAAETLNIVVGLADGTAPPKRIKVAVEDDGAGSTINAFATNSATLQGHPGAAGAAAVGAAFFLATPACGTTPATLEAYSSEGGAPILFDATGTRLSVPVVRQKPDFVGPDGGNDTFLGFTLASQGVTDNSTIAGCKNNPSDPNFFGTSAATPHVAGIAALMRQANPELTPSAIYQALRNSALPMATPSPNFQSGFGLVQADAAFALLPPVVPAAPTLTLAATSIAVNMPTTITWSAANATGCTASGSWSGALASSGTQTLTPATAATDTYTLTCANAAGSSAPSSVNLAVTAAASSGGGGGGGLDLLTLWSLAGIGIARILRLRERVLTLQTPVSRGGSMGRKSTQRGWFGGVLAALAGFSALVSAPAQATLYTLATRDDAVVGQDKTVVTVYEDTLYDLARKFSLGSEELIRVNPGVDPWLPGADKTLVVPDRHILPPGPREGIVVNLPEHRLYYYPKPKRGGPIEVITYPVSIGKMDWRTPLGLTHVIGKQKNPVWYPPESVRKEHAEAGDPLPPSVPSGPDNPLGLFAMRLAAGNGTYLIHGTNNPIAVGLAVTHGCIRMYPDDVAALFPLIPVGTPVRLINVPIKVAWVDGELLLEAHPPVDAQGQSFEPDIEQFAEMLRVAVGDTTVAIHWDYAREVLQKADGVIATVALAADDPNAPAPESTPPAEAPAADPATASSAVPPHGR